jgi:HSP20 family protein
MAEVNVVKQRKQEAAGVSREPGFDTSLFGGSLFSMNPFALMRHFTEDMDRLFTRMPRGGGESVAWSPLIEVKEKEGKLLVTAELPGLKKEDVKVHIDGDTLVLEGERKQETEEKREGYYRSERNYGKFYRSLLLPEGAKTDQAAAEFNNGVLEVTVPIPEMKAKPQEVPIQEGPKKTAQGS